MDEFEKYGVVDKDASADPPGPIRRLEIDQFNAAKMVAHQVEPEWADEVIANRYAMFANKKVHPEQTHLVVGRNNGGR